MPAGAPVTVRLHPCLRPNSLAASVIIISLVTLAGCDQDQPIVVENVPKDTGVRVNELKPIPPSDRMLAAIVPHGEEAYFFKVTGPIERVAATRPDFFSLVKSVAFENGKPQWELPSGWSQSEGSPGQIASITIPGESKLDLVVSSLALPQGDLRGYLLANVNRWRGQMGLSPVAESRLDAKNETEREIFSTELADGTPVTLVDFAGRFQGGMAAPFAGQPARTSAGGASSGDRAKLSYELPTGWEPAPGDGISAAVFTVGDAKATVTALPASNEVLPNVNRWRGQVGLGPLDEAELETTMSEVTLGDGASGQYVVLDGPAGGEEPQSILGVIAVRDETAWFVKMTGESKTVSDQKANFESFVKSLSFSQNQ